MAETLVIPMQKAIQSAKEGILAGEGGPFGACIVKGDQIIAVAHNTVLQDSDPTCHAEMNAIRLAAKKLATHELRDCVIYTTSEPCPMCLGAILWAQISKIFMGLPKKVAADYGFNDVIFYEYLLSDIKDRNPPYVVGVMSDKCKQLFD